MQQPVCVVIGVGPGIGMAVARRFGREGFTIAALSRKRVKLKTHVADLRAEGIAAEAFPADAGDGAELAVALQKIQTSLGDAQVLVYNAASVRAVRPDALTPETLEQTFRIDVLGALVAVQAILPAMKRAGQGTILFTGGRVAARPEAAYTTLSINKSALIAFCHCLAEDVEPQGIHVATITVNGRVEPGTRYDPDLLAEAYWTLHQEPKGRYSQEIIP